MASEFLNPLAFWQIKCWKIVEFLRIFQIVSNSLFQEIALISIKLYSDMLLPLQL